MGLGVLISYYYHFKPECYAAIAKHKLMLTTGAIIGLAPIVLWSVRATVNYTIGFTTSAIGFGCVLILALADTKKKFGPVSIVGSILAYVGRYSYSIYLWHRVVNEWALAELESRYGKLDYRIEFVLFLLGAVALGVITQEVIDVPCLKLRDVLFPSRSEPVVGYPHGRTELAA
jgi:peptidoglycan/LPS O-acetylase OafA/YrhL